MNYDTFFLFGSVIENVARDNVARDNVVRDIVAKDIVAREIDIRWYWIKKGRNWVVFGGTGSV